MAHGFALRSKQLGSRLLRPRSWLRGLGLIIAGALLPLGFAPFNWWWLAVISLALSWPLASSRKPWLSGWCFGLGVYGCGVSWIFVSLYRYTEVGAFGAMGATLSLAMALALFFALPFGLMQRLPKAWQTSMVFSLFWVGGEWLRSWLFTGFPWLYAGYATLHIPGLAGWIPVVGIFGASYLFVWLAQHLFTLCQHIRKRQWSWTPVLLLAGILGTGLVLERQQWQVNDQTRTLEVGIVQGNIDQADKWRAAAAPGIEKMHLELTEQLLAMDAELIIWPEAALPYLYSESQDFLQQLNSALLAAPSQSALLTGVLSDNQLGPRIDPIQVQSTPWQDPEQRSKIAVRNSVVLMDPRQTSHQIYHKQRLVPFGEYLPFAKQLIPLLPFLESFRYGITQGAAQQVPMTYRNWHLQPLVCYEIAFPGLIYNQLQQPVDFLVALSNDGWFNGSHGPSQHFQMARFRAKAFGVPVIRATNSGITGIIDHTGAVAARIPAQRAGILREGISTVTGTTPYRRLGPNRVLLLLCGITLLSLWLTRWHSGRT